MQQIYADLWQSEPEHPFHNRTTTHAYLLIQPSGNLLFYGMAPHEHELEQIAQLGGISRQYLSHRDEAGPALAAIKNRFQSALCCHELDADAATPFCPVDVRISQREVHAGSIEIIPTPGHSPGSVCFLVASRTGKKYLFTGDSIFPDGEGWGTYVARHQRATLVKSLELLRDVRPDVVMSSASSAPNFVREMGRGQWAEIIDNTIQSLT
jgi:hydroxyacylglutathione hydrolase